MEEPESQSKERYEAIGALLRDGRTLVEDGSKFGELESAGYGEREGKYLVLKDYEALYLLYSKRLELKDTEGRGLSFETLAEFAQQKSGESWTKFVIYRDLRSRGYVVRDGFGFGTDLRVYERGDFPEKAAKFVVFALDEGTEREMDELSDSVRQIIRMGKEAIVAVIERRGEVIYYKVGRATFRQ